MWNDTTGFFKGVFGGGDNTSTPIEKYQAPQVQPVSYNYASFAVPNEAFAQWQADRKKKDEEWLASMLKLGPEVQSAAQARQALILPTINADSEEYFETIDDNSNDNISLESIDADETAYGNFHGKDQGTLLSIYSNSKASESEGTTKQQAFLDTISDSKLIGSAEKQQLVDFLTNPKNENNDTNINNLINFISAIRQLVGKLRASKNGQKVEVYEIPIPNYNNLCSKNQIKKQLEANPGMTDFLLHINLSKIAELYNTIVELKNNSTKATQELSPEERTSKINTLTYGFNKVLKSLLVDPTNKLPVMALVYIIPRYYDYMRWLAIGAPELNTSTNIHKVTDKEQQVVLIAAKTAGNQSNELVRSLNDIDGDVGIDTYFIGSKYQGDTTVETIIVDIYKKINKNILSFFNKNSTKYNLPEDIKDQIFNEKYIDINYLTTLFSFLMQLLRTINKNKSPIPDKDIYFAVYSCAEICIKGFTDTNSTSKITSTNAKNLIQKIINRLTHISQTWKKLYDSYDKATTTQLGSARCTNINIGKFKTF